MSVDPVSTSPVEIPKPLRDARLLVGTIYITKVGLVVLHALALLVLVLVLMFGDMGFAVGGVIGLMFVVAISAGLIWAVLGWFEHSLSTLVQIAVNTGPRATT